MKTLRSISFAAIAAAVLAGCGHSMPVNTAAGVKMASVPSAMVHGQVRKFGWSKARFNSIKGKLHPVHLAKRGELPASVDNRKFCPPVEDQGQLGSCTAFSMDGLREYNEIKNNEKYVPLSQLWLYYNERVHMGPEYVDQDSGAMLHDGQWVLLNQGAAESAAWPYNIAKFTKKPPASADATAAAHKLQSAVDLASLDDVKTAIANGDAVAFGFTVYESFMNIGSDGMMPMPASGEGVLGGHAVLAVGYDDAKGALIVRNSWGTGWGDGGYFYMPYDFAKVSDNADEFWTSDK